MLFRGSTAILSLAVFFGTGFAAEATTLVVTKSEVLVSRGEGYQPAAGSVAVAPGDSVLVNAGGAAEIICADGGRLVLREPGYYAVPSDCAGAQAQLQDVTTGFESLGAMGPLLLGGAVLGGAIALIEASGSDDRPASR